jgi:hypothetical protein
MRREQYKEVLKLKVPDIGTPLIIALFLSLNYAWGILVLYNMVSLDGR